MNAQEIGDLATLTFSFGVRHAQTSDELFAWFTS